MNRSFLTAVLTALIVGLLFVVVCHAATDGDTDAGFTFKAEPGGGGWWWKSGVAYNRFQLSKTVYSGGYSSTPTYSYSWTYEVAPIVYRDKAVTVNKIVYSADWKKDVIKALDDQNDRAAFLQAIGGLGTAQPVTANAGYQNQLAAYQQTQQYTQGSTQYGYSLNQVSQYYGAMDLNALYQQDALLVQNAQQYGAQAHTDFADLLGRAKDHDARIAEILAKGQVIAAALASPPVQVGETRTFVFHQGPNGLEATQIANPPNAPPVDAGGGLQAEMTTNCGSCHSGNGPNVKAFNIASWPTMTRAAKIAVLRNRILTDDDAKRMPRDPADPTKPGPALPGKVANDLLQDAMGTKQ